MEKKKVVVVCGPTASGKTALAIDIAKHFDGEIVSADSMQIYKHFSIATAKPTTEEMQGIPHHLIDFLEPCEEFSVADYVELARTAIDDIIRRGKLPIVVGGTGLYIDSLIDNIRFDDTCSDKEFRERMTKLAEEKGNAYLREMLMKIDPETAEKLHENNLPRIIRALEVYELKGAKMSDVQRESRSEPSEYVPCFIALDYADREALYERINRRVDIMAEQGLLDEAREFFKHKDYTTASQAIGYKELFPYLCGEKTLSECLDKLKQETRRYAKRQLTWFRRNKRINWITIDEKSNVESCTEQAEKLVKSFLNGGA